MSNKEKIEELKIKKMELEIKLLEKQLDRAKFPPLI